MKTKLNSLTLAAACLALQSAMPVSLRADSIPVTTTADSGPGSLRAALAGAANGDTIDASGVAGTITLTSGELVISKSVTLLGPGSKSLVVSGDNASRVFNVTGAEVTIHGLTIANGQSTQNGAGVNAAGSTGSVITIKDCVVTNNHTPLDGGGVCNHPGVTMTISNCTVAGNSATGSGGGILNDNSTVTVVASTLSGNSANLGGALFNNGASPSGTLTIIASTLNNNSANYGSAIYTGSGGSGSAAVTIANSTLSDNSGHESINNDSYWGGTASLRINASTFSRHSGTGIFNDGGTMEVGDTIFNAPASASEANLANRGGTITSYGYNLSSDDGGGFLNHATDQVKADPKLGPLQNNGGPSPTHALLAGSPALDKGKRNAITALALDTDQRGLVRPVDFAEVPNATGGDGSDIGAFESQSGSDTDADGLPDAWELACFGGLGQCGTDDCDGDGHNNWQEWQADTSPTDANDFLHITSVTRSGTYNTLWWTSKSTRLYQVERRTALDASSLWETIVTNAAPGWNDVGFDNTGPRCFYRIRVVQP